MENAHVAGRVRLPGTRGPRMLRHGRDVERHKTLSFTHGHSLLQMLQLVAVLREEES